jgi:hypothetical protein
LNELTPKIRCSGKSVDPALVFSIDSQLFRDPLPVEADGAHHDEVETTTLLRGTPAPANASASAHTHAYVHTTAPSDVHPHPEVLKAAAHPPPPPLLDEPTLAAALRQLPKEYVYRVKGFIRFSSPSPSTSAAAADSEGSITPEREEERWWILNWAFGRWELVGAPAPAPAAAVATDEDEHEHGVVRLTVMGERGEVGRYAKRLAEALGATVA